MRMNMMLFGFLGILLLSLCPQTYAGDFKVNYTHNVVIVGEYGVRIHMYFVMNPGDLYIQQDYHDSREKRYADDDIYRRIKSSIKARSHSHILIIQYEYLDYAPAPPKKEATKKAHAKYKKEKGEWDKNSGGRAQILLKQIHSIWNNAIVFLDVNKTKYARLAARSGAESLRSFSFVPRLGNEKSPQNSLIVLNFHAYDHNGDVLVNDVVKSLRLVINKITDADKINRIISKYKDAIVVNKNAPPMPKKLEDFRNNALLELIAENKEKAEEEKDKKKIRRYLQLISRYKMLLGNQFKSLDEVDLKIEKVKVEIADSEETVISTEKKIKSLKRMLHHLEKKKKEKLAEENDKKTGR
ncbi:hypothetical protein ACFL54_05715 [Planctomycetota bacterium]